MAWGFNVKARIQERRRIELKLLMRRSVFVFLFIGLTLCFCIEGWGTDWRQYSENDKVVFYCDSESMAQPSKDIVRVWEKRVFKETFVKEIVIKGGGLFRTLSYAISLIEVNCRTRESWVVASHAYSTEYRVISSSGSEDAPWNLIVPHAIDNELYKRVCK